MKSVLGVALGAAVVGGCAVIGDATAPPGLAIVGLVLLAVAGAFHGKLLVAMALALPGAALVGWQLERPDWMAVAAVAVITIAAPLVADVDMRSEEAGWEGGTPIAFAIASFGLFACVPDTEEARVLLVVAVVAALFSKHFGSAGVCIGVFVWIAAFDARGRPAAFVGAIAALGLLLFEPIGVRVRGARVPLVQGRGALLALLGVQLALTGYASRVVGLERSVGNAVVLAVPAVLAGVAAGAFLGRPTSS